MPQLKLTALHMLVYGSFWVGSAAGLTPWLTVLAGILIWVSIADFMTMEIPDLAALLLVVTGAAMVFWVGRPALLDHILGLVVWPLLTGAVAFAYVRLRGWHGLGLGDVKLMAGIGLWAGFEATIWVILSASLAGIAMIILNNVLRRQPIADLDTSVVAFGPFLCLSAWLTILVEGLD